MTVAALGTVGAAGCSRHSGTPDPVLSKDVAFAFDAEGNRYEMDFIRYEVRRVDAVGATVWKQGDRADPELFNSPTALAVDSQGTVFVADRANGEIERLSPQGAIVSTFGEDLLTAQDLALDPMTSRLYVSDSAAHRIQVFSVAGESLQLIGGFGTDAAGLNFPRGLAISYDRELHVVDAGNARIQVYGLDGTFRRSYGGRQDASGQLHAPRDIVFDAAGQAIVSDTMSARLAWFDSRGVFLNHSQLRLDGRVGHPLYLAMGPGGTLYATVI
jgi:DNA-binding beta-propeller fold protein YncE